MAQRVLTTILLPTAVAALLWLADPDEHDCSSCGGVWAEVHERASRSVVTVECIGPRDTGYQEVLSGVVVRPGLVATVGLVPANAGQMLCVRDAEGRDHPATWLGLDPLTGVTVLRVADPGPPAMQTATADVRVGQPVLLVGNAYGLRLSAKVGYVAGRERTVTIGGMRLHHLLQLSLPTHPGDSGAVVCNCEGEMVALVRSGMVDPATGHPVETIAFAVPVRHVLAAVDRVLANPRQAAQLIGKPGYVGIVLAEDDGPEPGVRIARVVPGSPADRAGLRRGDVLLAVDNKQLSTADCLAEALAGKRAGAVVELTVRRGAQVFRRTLRLEQRSLRPGTPPRSVADLSRRIDRLEQELRRLKAQLRRQAQP